MKPPVVPVRTASDIMSAKSKLGDRFSPEAIKKQEETEKVSKNEMSKSQDDLEKLIFLGRIEREFDISGFKFKLQTLSSLSQRNILSEITKKKEEERVFFLKSATIAKSIVAINGIPFESFLNVEVDDFDSKVDFVNNLQSNLVDLLFKKYGEMYEESNSLLEMDEIKK